MCLLLIHHIFYRNFFCNHEGIHNLFPILQYLGRFNPAQLNDKY